MQTHILGFPRIGARRELKTALEAFWQGRIPPDELLATGRMLKKRHWDIQAGAGLSMVAVGDFSFYDHVLDTCLLLGLSPERFGPVEHCLDAFRLARGDAAADLAPMTMTKWFNTNYHYLVPELSAHSAVSLHPEALLQDVTLATESGYQPKPTILGPVTFLSLARGVQGFDPWSLQDEVFAAYAELLWLLETSCPLVQIDEPILCTDMSPQAQKAFMTQYPRLNESLSSTDLLLTTYFGTLGENLDLAFGSGCAGIHYDCIRGAAEIQRVVSKLPASLFFSAGLVDGRNIWRTDAPAAHKTVCFLQEKLGTERLMLASSCSLLHAPVDLSAEKELDAERRSWMVFAVQKCEEIVLLEQMLAGTADQELVDENRRANESRRQSSRVHDQNVQARCLTADFATARRQSAFSARQEAQKWLNLPLLPTTTIGSFPQTAEIRQQRAAFRQGSSSPEEYTEFLRAEIGRVLKYQEDLGLDVLVHGEPERNDMVEYFGQQMQGFCFTQNGWVQSYGSRCVKPPIIFGDISRPAPMTVDWMTYAQSQTKKTVKGMLTGPVTMLCWSFVRDDLPRHEVCRQLALALYDEIMDLEAAGIRLIQIDEAAFSEGMPLTKQERPQYLDWASGCFRLATSGVADTTQIHSHMCYSVFTEIMPAIAAMDADVISIEASRSKMTLLDAFEKFEYPNAIGPGVYDIHSPRVPGEEEMYTLLQRALACIPVERLWVNPDCGLKTRAWPETLQSLANMVAAARRLRAKCSEAEAI